MKNKKNIITNILFILSIIVFSSFETFAEETWKTTVFGNVGGQDKINDKYFKTQVGSKGNVELKVSGNKGKISGSTDGFMFYYTEVSLDENFEISADLEIKDYNKNNQVSFGLMVRDEILNNKSEKKFTSDYIAAGPINLKKENANIAFIRNNKKLSKFGNFEYNPVVGEKLKLKIKKSGEVYKLIIGDQKPVIIDNVKFNNKKLFIGTYVVRNADIVFSNISIKKNTEEVKSISVDYSKMKKQEYIVGEDLNLEGLKVTMITKDGVEKTLSQDQYIVSGFENDKAGKVELSVNYNGVAKKFPVEVKGLSLTKLDIKYYPFKTEYYKLDKFDTTGMQLRAIYNDGYKVVELDDSSYIVSIDNNIITKDMPFMFNSSRKYTVKITSKENPKIMANFDVNVKDADLTSIKIVNQPAKVNYFKKDKLETAGMAVYAYYSDGSKVRLASDEYFIDELDSNNVGNKTVKVYHKNKTANLVVDVKEKEFTNIAVTTYPKTTYYVGDKFNTKGMVVSKLYNNGDMDTINDFDVDTSNFDSSKAGEYVVKIKTSLGEASLKTTVREKKEILWKTAIFGQSTAPETKNYIKFNKNSIEIAALSGGGKITGDHDGITFYYTELDANEDNFVLSADIEVINYAKKPHDGQESFGLMARDAIGVDGDSALSASNIALLGGFSGGTKFKNGTQLIVRTGVTAQNGAGSKGLQKIMIKDEKPEAKNTPYRLILSKNNSGFTGKIDNGTESLIYEPEIMKVQNGKMYVGFFAARVADIKIRNINLEVSAANTDFSRIEKPTDPMVPDFSIESLEKVSLKDYKLMLKPNVNGVITIKKGQEIIVNNEEIKSEKEVTFDTNISENSDTNFSIVFTPSDTQVLSSYKSIVKNFTVEMKTYQDGKDIYVSPKGMSNGDGSKENPLDLDTAIAFVEPGQTIIVQDGRYVRNESLFINKYNDGKKRAMKKLIAEKGTRPVIDFNKRSEGVVHSGDYWYIYGIDFTKSAPNRRGYVLGGNHNIIEFCEFYENGDTGMQISRTDYTENNISEWPSDNLIKNCTSYNNADPSENNADGFAAKLTVGYGNVFDGCISHNNADDGWDLYTKVGRGKIGPVTIKNSVVYGNGSLEGKKPGNGDGNGFKLGGEGLNVHHIIKNSVAFGNYADGFTSNSNPGIIATKNISFNNKRNINFSSYTGIPLDFEINGFKSYQYNNKLNPESDEVADENKGRKNYFYNGETSINSKGKELKKVEIVMPSEIKRKSNGDIDFSFISDLK